jgi:hypothetical protein
VAGGGGCTTEGTNALYRGGGSIGIIGAARSGLLVARAPEYPEHERILASSKSNLGPPLPALRYRIAPRTLSPLSPSGTEVPAVEWLGPCDYTAATLLGDGATGSGRTPAVDEAAAWLRAQLEAGPRPAAAPLAAARERGWGDKTLSVARARVQEVCRLRGFGPAGQWQWEASPPATISADSAGDRTSAETAETADSGAELSTLATT